MIDMPERIWATKMQIGSNEWHETNELWTGRSTEYIHINKYKDQEIRLKVEWDKGQASLAKIKQLEAEKRVLREFVGTQTTDKFDKGLDILGNLMPHDWEGWSFIKGEGDPNATIYIGRNSK